jgi:hypothetical protein
LVDNGIVEVNVGQVAILSENSVCDGVELRKTFDFSITWGIS